MLDLKRRRPDVRAYVAALEEWIIRTLAPFNVRGERREDRVGVWVKRPTRVKALRTRSPPSACACANGCRSTASPSMSSRIFRIFPRSCPAASPIQVRRHLAGRSRPPRRDGRCRYRAPAGVCGSVRAGRGAGAKRRCIDRLGRRALRRYLQLAGDVAALLGQAAKAVGIAPDLVDMQIGFFVQRPE